VTSEYALLKRAQSYDEQAIGELYDRYAPRIYGYIYKRIQNTQLAEDLTSEVFVRVLEAIRSERFWHTSFVSWLYRIAHNLLVDYYRSRPSVLVLPLEEHLIAGLEELNVPYVDKFALENLQEAISQLTQAQQQVIALRFGEQLMSKEVAEIMGKSIGAIEALQFRALASLRRILEVDED